MLAPLVAILAITCALWPAARQRLVWLLLALAVFTGIVTPVTVNAGEWLAADAHSSPALDTHMELGETMSYFSAALVIAAALLAVMHVRQTRGHPVKPIAVGLIAVLVLATAVTAMVQIYRIGQSGAQAVWGNHNHCQMHSADHRCTSMTVASAVRSG